LDGGPAGAVHQGRSATRRSLLRRLPRDLRQLPRDCRRGSRPRRLASIFWQLLLILAGPLAVSPVQAQRGGLAAAAGSAETAGSAATSGGAARWTAIGPDGGQATLLVFAPSSAQAAFAVMGPGGVFVSNDGGAHWSAAGDGLVAHEVLALAIDPHNSAVAYAGTRDGGVFKTVNGGGRWVASRRGLEAREVRALAVDAADAARLYAGTADGVFVSADAGRGWRRLAELPPGSPRGVSGAHAGGGEAVESLQATPEALFASSRSGVWRSLDRGATWVAKRQGLGRELFLRPVTLVANPGYGSLYAVSETGSFRTANRGDSWTPLLPGGVEALAVTAGGDIYVAGGELLARSHDGGASFRVLPRFAAGRITALASPPGTEAVLAGTESRGLFRTDDGAETWQPASAGLAATRVTSVAVAAATPTRLFAMLRSSRVELLRAVEGRDRGRRWAPLTLPALAGGEALPAPAGGEASGTASLVRVPAGSPNQVFAATGRGVLRSLDGGDSWTALRLDLLNSCVVPQALAATAARPATTLYLAAAGASLGCFAGCAGARSLDGGESWDCLRPLDEARAIAVDPREPATVYVATGDAMDFRLVKSVDRGAGWVPAEGGLEGATVMALAIHPESRQTLVALGADGTVYRTADGAASWRPVGSVGAPVRAGATLIADPRAAAVYYAALPGVGMVHSADGGATWTALGDGLPSELVSGALAIDPRSPGVLYAGTDGRGIYKLPLASP
jgi:hypothetical protein